MKKKFLLALCAMISMGNAFATYVWRINNTDNKDDVKVTLERKGFLKRTDPITVNVSGYGVGEIKSGYCAKNLTVEGTSGFTNGQKFYKKWGNWKCSGARIDIKRRSKRDSNGNETSAEIVPEIEGDQMPKA